MNVQLGNYAPSTVAANVVPNYAPSTVGASVVRNTAPLSLAPIAPTADLSKSRSGCHRKRMGRAGTRCFCNGKLVKNSRC